MACDRFTEGLRAHALGAPLRADAAAHLAVCSHCQAVLESEERVLAILDGALHAVASVTPGPDFSSRVRAHVEQPSPWTASGWRTTSAAAALALVVIGAIFVSRTPRESPTVRELPPSPPIERTERPASPRSGEAEVVLKTMRRPETHVPRHARAEEHPARGPEVLVPAEQREKVARLVASLRAGRPEVISMLMRMQAGKSVEPPALTVAPLRIEPVVVTTLPSVGSILDR